MPRRFCFIVEIPQLYVDIGRLGIYQHSNTSCGRNKLEQRLKSFRQQVWRGQTNARNIAFGMIQTKSPAGSI